MMKISVKPFFVLNIFSTDKNLSFVGWVDRSETQLVSQLQGERVKLHHVGVKFISRDGSNSQPYPLQV